MRFHKTPVQRVDYILSHCAGKKVLHLGCTNWPYTDQALADGSLLHTRIAESASQVFGLDSDSRGLEVLRTRGFGDLYLADLEQLDLVRLSDTFDLVVAGEMIEHLSNPGRFLEGVKRFLHNGSRLIITTVNAYCAMRLLIYGLRGKGGSVEPVHPDHVAYYSFSTLKVLLERYGLIIEDFLFYDLGPEHRPYNRRILNFANDAAVKLFPQLSDGIIAVCAYESLPEAEGKSITLV